MPAALETPTASFAHIHASAVRGVFWIKGWERDVPSSVTYEQLLTYFDHDRRLRENDRVAVQSQPIGYMVLSNAYNTDPGATGSFATVGNADPRTVFIPNGPPEDLKTFAAQWKIMPQPLGRTAPTPGQMPLSGAGGGGGMTKDEERAKRVMNEWIDDTMRKRDRAQAAYEERCAKRARNDTSSAVTVADATLLLPPDFGPATIPATQSASSSTADAMPIDAPGGTTTTTPAVEPSKTNRTRTGAGTKPATPAK